MFSIKHIGFIVLVLFSVTACLKEPVKPNVGGIQYFPNSVGDQWEYEVYDSSQTQPTNLKTYPVTVSITGTKKLIDGLEATIWQYQYPWGRDTNYVRIVGDTVKVFDLVYSRYPEDLNFPRQIFLLPFQSQKRWSGKLLWTDSFQVAFTPSLSVQFNRYDSCYKISRHYIGPNMEFNDEYWFKPNIGMVMIHYNEYNLGPNTKLLWQLKKYDLH